MSAIDDATRELAARWPDAPRELHEYAAARGLYLIALRYWNRAVRRVDDATDALAAARSRRDALAAALEAEDARLDLDRKAATLAGAIELTETRYTFWRAWQIARENAAMRQGVPYVPYVPTERKRTK